MRRPSTFRPSVTALESRGLLSAAGYPDPVRTFVAESYAAQAARAENPVVLLGDSITLGWGSENTPGWGQASFRAAFAPLGAANFGINGDTTANLLYRVETGALAGKPRLAVVMIGTNDLLGGATPDQAAEGVASVVHAIRAASPETEVLLLGVLPTRMAPFNERVAATDARIARLGDEPGVTYLDLQDEFLGPDGAARAELLVDYVHPNAAGYRVMARAIDGTVDRLFGRPESPETPASPPTDRPVEVPDPATPTPPAKAVAHPIPIPIADGPAGVLLPIVLEVPTTSPKPAPGRLAVGPRR